MDLSTTKTRRQCTAKSKRTGERCRGRPIRGGTVCWKHGGAAPQVRAKAEEQLRLARDELMELLLGIARDTTQTASDRLRAITWALERAGFKGAVGVDLTVVPAWQLAVRSMFEESEVDTEDQLALSGRKAKAIEAGHLARIDARLAEADEPVVIDPRRYERGPIVEPANPPLPQAYRARPPRSRHAG